MHTKDAEIVAELVATVSAARAEEAGHIFESYKQFGACFPTG